MINRLRAASRQCLGWLPALIPSSCALCGKTAPQTICASCDQRFFKQMRHRCDQCAIALPPTAHTGLQRCGACLHRAPAFDQTIVAVDYAPPLDHLVWALKFGARLALAPCFARMLADALLRHPQRPHSLPQLLIAVPLGPQRLAQRGFNQAHEIARPLARQLGIALDRHLISRTRETQAQALLHPNTRRKNIRAAFTPSAAAVAAGTLRDLHIGVVDDVMTTGETLNELATTLKRYGAARVTNLVFARTLPK